MTSLVGVVLLTLLILQVASAVFFALLSYNVAIPSGPTYDVVRPVHFLVGFALMPLIGIKLASTGWRSARYYTRGREYRAAGSPSWPARLIAPLLIVSAVSVTASGVEMWSFQNQLNWPWTAIHNTAAFTFVTVLVVHVVLHVREAHREAAADLAGVPAGVTVAGGADVVSRSEPVGGAMTRRAVLGAGVVFGAALGVGASGWPSSRLGWLQPVKSGADALDFPIMNYEGGMQRVDVDRWRLRVSGAVATPIELTEAQLLALPMEEHRYAINCVTGWTATRTWRGVPVTTVLEMAGARADWGHVDIRSTSGYHWDHRRADLTLKGTLLCTHIDGVRLNDDHGYPVRLIVPGIVGKSNIKWIDGLDVGIGGPQLYLGPHVDFNNPTITGPTLPRDPAGMRP